MCAIMIKNNTIILCAFLLLSSIALEAKNESLLARKVETPKIAVNNKILSKINGKVISTVDIMKKMDMLFYRQFPQYTSSVEARFQFYQANWKHVLEEFINKELILADAAESKIEVSSGDIRQEMESYFGPNIITNLDKVGLNFDEASKMVQDEILLRRMLTYRVNAKAIRMVTPALTRQAYEAYAKDIKNIRSPSWDYQVISIRGPDQQLNQKIANEAYSIIQDPKFNLTNLPNKLTERNLLNDKTKASVSEVFHHRSQEMSEAYREALLQLTPKTFSRPISQKSRADKSTIYRIFYLIDKKEGGIPSFKEMEPKLKDKLLSETSAKETEDYIERLHKHYHVKEGDLSAMVPDDYKPFSIK